MQDLGEFVVGNVTLNILERLIPGLKPATYRFWWKAFAIALRLEGWIDNNPLECKVMINHTQYKFQINNLTQKPSRIILWKGSLFVQPVFIQICSATIKKKQIYVCTYCKDKNYSHKEGQKTKTNKQD